MDGQSDALDTLDTTGLARDLRVVLGKLKRRLREQARPGDLTPSQTEVLGRLDRDGPASVSTLALAEGVKPQSMGATVASLVEAGFMVGTPDPTDGRRTILTLTDACRGFVAESRAARDDWLSSTIRHRLDPTEQEQLATAVRLLEQLVET